MGCSEFRKQARLSQPQGLSPTIEGGRPHTCTNDQPTATTTTTTTTTTQKLSKRCICLSLCVRMYVGVCVYACMPVGVRMCICVSLCVSVCAYSSCTFYPLTTTYHTQLATHCPIISYFVQVVQVVLSTHAQDKILVLCRKHKCNLDFWILYYY